MTTTYHCAGFRPIRATHPMDPDARSAARVFADRLARRLYGRRGYCRTIRLDSTTVDGTSATYEAFVGKSAPGQPGTTVGHNEWLTVTTAA